MSPTRECDLCGLACGKYPVPQRVADVERFFCCSGCMNVYLILWESGTIQAGQDIRETELFRRSLQLGLIPSGTVEKKPDPTTQAVTSASEELLLHVSGMWCTSCSSPCLGSCRQKPPLRRTW